MSKMSKRCLTEVWLSPLWVYMRSVKVLTGLVCTRKTPKLFLTVYIYTLSMSFFLFSSPYVFCIHLVRFIEYFFHGLYFRSFSVSIAARTTEFLLNLTIGWINCYFPHVNSYSLCEHPLAHLQMLFLCKFILSVWLILIGCNFFTNSWVVTNSLFLVFVG